MKKIILFSLLALVFASCAHGPMKNITKQLPPLDESAEVIVYEMGDTVPERSEILGGFYFFHNGDWETVLETAKKEARAAGGNGLEIQLQANQLQANRYPSKNRNKTYHLSAFILNINDSIEPTKPTPFEKKEFQDYVVTKEDDTIPCSIVFESKSHLQFVHGYNRQGYSKAIYLPKSDLLSYYIKNPEVLKTKQRENYSPKLQFDLSAGIAANVPTDRYTSSSIPILYSGNVRFQIKAPYHLGVHYDYKHNDSFRRASYFSPYGNHGGVIVMDNLYPLPPGTDPNPVSQTTQFIAGCFGIHGYSIFNAKEQLDYYLNGGHEIPHLIKKNRINVEVRLGYFLYNEEGEDSGLSYHCTGGAPGLGLVMDYNYIPLKHFGFVLGGGVDISLPFQTEIQWFNGDLDEKRIHIFRSTIYTGICYYL